MGTDRFWMKCWDEGLADVDPREWETAYTEVVRAAFEEHPATPAFCFMGVEVTFRGLDAYPGRFADMLIKNGFRKGDGVALSAFPLFHIAGLFFCANCIFLCWTQLLAPNPDAPGPENVKAFVVLRQGRPAGDGEAVRADILSFAKEHLAPYEVPRSVEFRAELPLTTVGKIDKKALRKESSG